MSNFNNWKKPELCGWGGNRGSIRPPRPPGLRGREIGLFYRNFYKTRKVHSSYINFTIPNAALTKLQNNLKAIVAVARKHNIALPKNVKKSYSISSKSIENLECIGKNLEEKPIKNDQTQFNNEDFLVKSTYITNAAQNKPSSSSLSDVIPIQYEVPECNDKPKNKPGPSSSSCDFIPIENEVPEINCRPKKQNKPGPSSACDFIPIGNEVADGYGEPIKLLSLRATSDYKYGYEDIITGTFEEKLDESLSKGIAISMVNKEINEMSVALQEEYNIMVQSDGYNKMLSFRQRLPAYMKYRKLLNVINNNQVVVISGETGCGKSTQVPQIILDDALKNKRGANVKIIVTQPRRIAASSLAMRVAEERAQRLGNSVGYAVRLEKVDARPRGSVTFCTTGILLADLEVNQGLTNYSHVILDEVHERDTHIDLTMCMLKQVLKKRADLKLILMSATLDAEKLSGYFNNCPMVHIEGLAYPVKDIYLEEILEMTRFQLMQAPVMQPPKKKRHMRLFNKQAAKEMEQDIRYKSEIYEWLESIKFNISREVYHTLQNYQIEELNMDLVMALLFHICHGPPGAILVFLPGIGDITSLLRRINDSHAFPSTQYEVYPLHSKLNSLEQHKIFVRPPDGKRKIVIATNIAETSITIDDIVYVIDCGKMKLSGLNIEQNVSTLKTEWISQANLRQRRGRAGRCQPGVCFHLVTSFRAQNLHERVLPELQRSNLLEPALAIKKLRLGKAADAFSMVPDPPALTTVQWAVKHLQQCGALDDKESLTPLGWHLARLPVHPAAGKLLLLGALFGCLDRAASVAAVWGFKDPFVLVIGKEIEVKKAKRDLALGEPSDHVAMSQAIMEWELQQGYHHRRTFAFKNYLSQPTLELLSDMKSQLGDSLKQMGFLASADVKTSWENRNSDNLSLFKTIVAAALYPNIGTTRWRGLNSRKRNVALSVQTPEDGKVTIHPSSVMTMSYKYSNERLCNNPGANWLVYWIKQRSSDLFLFDVTLVYTLPLLFFGELNVSDAGANSPEDCFISISSLKVRCKKETADILLELRSLLDQVLASKITASSEHATRHSEFEELVLNSVIELITAEDEQADYLDTSDVTDSDASDTEPLKKE